MEPYTPLSRSIAGKTLLITGAASGMGRATAHLFAREGANVMATDLNQNGLSLDEAKRAVASVQKDSGSIFAARLPGKKRR